MDRALLMFGIVILLAIGGSCHKDVDTMNGRIVGGEVISALYLPYQVSVRRRDSTNGAYAHLCGGSILDKRTIITAAHCVHKRAADNYLVVAGTEVRTGMDGGVVVRVEKIVPHESYNSTTTDNDIALLFVSPPLPVGSHLKIDKIEPARQLALVGTEATVSGWGTTIEDGLHSPRLQYVQVMLVNNADCQKAYSWRPVTDAMICAAVPSGGKDACNGDSGGPLVANNQLIGIVSWGLGCGRIDYPGVYASVSYFQQWIADQRAAYKSTN